MKRALALLALLFATPASAQSTEVITGWGATLRLPKGWTIARAPGAATLTNAPRDIRLTLRDAGGGAGARAVLAHDRQAPDLLLPQSPGGGWRERAEARYVLPVATHRLRRAVAFRGPAGWTVLTIEASTADAEALAGDLAAIEASIHPRGWTPERFAGPPARLTPARVAALRAFVAAGMRDLAIPGAALALVDHGRVVFEGGLGVRDIERPARVTARTRFMIASNTKGLTTLLMARLVDEGVLGWDDPVTRAWPGFRLGDAALARRLRLRDMVCACTGLPRADLQWVFNTPPGQPSAQVFDELAMAIPTTPFGERYQYNNLIVAAAGFIAAAHVQPGVELGRAYDEAMRDKILRPLGMNDTTFDFDAALKGDHAAPHAAGGDGQTVRAGYDLDRAAIPFRPSGGAWSSAHDMIRYVAQELSPGEALTGARVVSAANVLERRQRRVMTGDGAAYGMGLRVERMGGVQVVHHGGSLLGYQSDWVALPDDGVGAVLLMNADAGADLRGPFLRRLLEIVHGAPPLASAQLKAAAGRRRIEARALAARITAPPPATMLTSLSPRYVEPSLGQLLVDHNGNALRFRFASLATAIGARREPDGSTAWIAIGPGMTDFVFVPGAADGRRTLTIRDGQHAYVFREVP